MPTELQDATKSDRRWPIESGSLQFSRADQHSIVANQDYLRLTIYFDRIKGMFDAKLPDDFQPVLEAHKNNQRVPRYDYERVSIFFLVGADKLATRA